MYCTQQQFQKVVPKLFAAVAFAIFAIFVPIASMQWPSLQLFHKRRAAVYTSVVVLVTLAGQRSSCSDLVFSNKCALWCSILLRDNTAQAGEFSVATNKTQVRLCQAMSDYLNKCQPRNQTFKRSSSDPQDKGPIDFPH